MTERAKRISSIITIGILSFFAIIRFVADYLEKDLTEWVLSLPQEWFDNKQDGAFRVYSNLNDDAHSIFVLLGDGRKSLLNHEQMEFCRERLYEDFPDAVSIKIVLPDEYTWENSDSFTLYAPLMGIRIALERDVNHVFYGNIWERIDEIEADYRNRDIKGSLKKAQFDGINAVSVFNKHETYSTKGLFNVYYTYYTDFLYKGQRYTLTIKGDKKHIKSASKFKKIARRINDGARFM